MAGEASRISKKALAALGSDGTEPVLSAVAVWEAAIKRGLGKLDAPLVSDDEAMRRYDVEVLC